MISALLAVLFATSAVQGSDAGLHSGQQPATPTRAVSACSAVTREDVERELGRKVSEGVAEDRARQSTCDYTTRFGQVTVTVQKLAAPVDLRRAIPEIVAALPAASARTAETAVPNGKAFFIDIANAGTQLHIIRNDRDHLLISVLGCGGPSEASRIAVALATAAIRRL